MDDSSNREVSSMRRLEERRAAPSTFDLGYETESGALFIAVPRELTIITEKVLRRERKISKLMQQIPGVAGDEVLRELVFDEVVSSNEIEGIHSTRRQIEEALRKESGSSASSKRFREFAKLYLDMTFSSPKIPENVSDIRTIYDQIMLGEKVEDDLDGEVFRKDIVYISNGTKTVHTGLYPEARIIEAIEKMLHLTESLEMPSLYSALASHYIFEYAHPFYDGNGRVGRYLLSLFLEESISKPTALSLSRTIAENKQKYYDAFSSAENKLNHGELTFFIYKMLELIFSAQDEMMRKLESNRERLISIKEACAALEKPGEFSEKELSLIYGLAQRSAFGMFHDIPLERLAELIGLKPQQTRKYMADFESRGIALKVRGRNPVTFALTEEFKRDRFPYLTD